MLKAGDAGAEHEGREKVPVAPSFLAIPRFPPRAFRRLSHRLQKMLLWRNDDGGPNSKGTIFEGQLFLGKIVQYPIFFQKR